MVELRLQSIPLSGYLSPDAVVVCLSSLIKLKTFVLRFRSTQSCPTNSIRHLSSLARVTLPSLTQFVFYGPNKYIENLVAQVNISLLDHLEITLFDELLFETSQLNQFVGRTKKFKVPSRALFEFDNYSDAARFSLSEDPVHGPTLVFPISCVDYLDFQLPFLFALSSLSSSPLRHSSLERLDILTRYSPLSVYDTDDTTWLELSHPFTAVKDLYLDNRSVLHFGPTLQEFTEERATYILPALQRIFVQDYGRPENAKARGAIESFIAARRFYGRPVAVHNWE